MGEKLEAAERERRRGLTDHEAMQDAQSMCVPCKLCGSAAHISDAGPGSGYYIRCSNSRTFRDYNGCLISDRRVSGWAYNVAEWWNRLHATPDRSDDALAEENRRLRAEIAKKDAALHEKNIALDALAWVWCDGGCAGGVGRFTPVELTEEMVAKAERNTRRLRTWLTNRDHRAALKGNGL